MSEVVGPAGAALAWLGACLMILSDGRRGLSAGLLAAAAGIGLAAGARDPASGALILAGGVACALPRLRDGIPGFGLLPAGSTPRLILCLVGGAAGAYSGTLLGAETEPWLLIASVSAGGLAVARLLGSEQRQSSLAATALFVLALGGTEVAAGSAPPAAGALLAAALAALISLAPPLSSQRAS